MTGLHASTLVVAAAAIGALVLAAGWAALGRRVSRSLVDAGIVIVLVAVGVGALTGLSLPLAGAGPRDPLHALYAAAAMVSLPIARVIGARRDPPRDAATGRGLARWLIAGALVTLGLLFRLWQTG